MYWMPAAAGCLPRDAEDGRRDAHPTRCTPSFFFAKESFYFRKMVSAKGIHHKGTKDTKEMTLRGQSTTIHDLLCVLGAFVVQIEPLPNGSRA